MNAFNKLRSSVPVVNLLLFALDELVACQQMSPSAVAASIMWVAIVKGEECDPNAVSVNHS